MKDKTLSLAVPTLWLTVTLSIIPCCNHAPCQKFSLLLLLSLLLQFEPCPPHACCWDGGPLVQWPPPSNSSSLSSHNPCWGLDLRDIQYLTVDTQPAVWWDFWGSASAHNLSLLWYHPLVSPYMLCFHCLLQGNQWNEVTVWQLLDSCLPKFQDSHLMTFTSWTLSSMSTCKISILFVETIFFSPIHFLTGVPPTFLLAPSSIAFPSSSNLSKTSFSRVTLSHNHSSFKIYSSKISLDKFIANFYKMNIGLPQRLSCLSLELFFL